MVCGVCVGCDLNLELLCHAKRTTKAVGYGLQPPYVHRPPPPPDNSPTPSIFLNLDMSQT